MANEYLYISDTSETDRCFTYASFTDYVVRMGKSRIVAWLSTSKSNHPANIDTIRMRDKCHCAVCKCHSNHTIFGI